MGSRSKRAPAGAEDPQEQTNVIDDQTHAAAVRELDEKLTAFYDRHQEPEKSGLLVRDQIGRFNTGVEPWDPAYDGYSFPGGWA